MAFAYKRAITIDHTKCGSADSANFPVFFAGHSSLATVANGGRARSSSGYDIGFYSDAALTTKLAWETVSWSASTGLGEWWIKVPTLSASTDTVIYVAVGDASTTTDQSNKTGVWSSSEFAYVLHGGDGTTLNLTDSSANNLAVTNSGIIAATGKVGGAFSNNSGAAKATLASYAYTSGAYTVSAWINRQWGTNAGFSQMVTAAYTGTAGIAQVFTAGAGTGQDWVAGDALAFGNGYVKLRAPRAIAAIGTPTAYTWHHIVLVLSSAVAQIYLDGAPLTMRVSSPATVPSITGTADILADSSSAYLLTDELKYSPVVRSASWILSEYNNQAAPGTFYAVGSELAVTAANFGFFRLMQ